MMLRTARRSSRWSSLALLVGMTLGVSALISGCCHSYEEDVCALMDQRTTCPSREEFAELNGEEEVLEGPQSRSFVDLRSDTDGSLVRAHGSLCCYRVKRESCSQPKVY